MYHDPNTSLTRKRARVNDDDDLTPQGFQEHRAKRQLSSLPFRRSPEIRRRYLATFQTDCVPLPSPTVADITPVGSDSEDLPAALIHEPRSAFSPWSSSPLEDSLMQSSQASSYLASSQDTHLQTQESIAYSDDLEMTDSGLLLPPPFHSDPSITIAGRIPTPIHAQFSHSNTRAIHQGGNKGSSHLDTSLISHDNNTYDQTSSLAANRNGRRLPSPISEDEITSPSILISGLNDVQMGDQDEPGPSDITGELKSLPPRKGHMRSKHSLRSWGPSLAADMPNGDAGIGVKKGFSMGYRSDCEKCRMRVPGHFSHVITYES